MDNLVFEEAVNAEIDQSEFISKKWIYVNDNNTGNYTSQVILDTTPLSNAGGYVNWSEGYIVMPLVVQLTSLLPASLPLGGSDASGNSPLEASYAWAMKSGYWNMINSMSVEFNNQNIVQQTPFLNVFRSFKALTSFSKDDVKNEGATIGFFPDTASSWGYCPPTATSSNFLLSSGIGLSNNRQAPVLLRDATTDYVITAQAGDSLSTSSGGSGGISDSVFFNSLSSHNKGFLKRQSVLNYTPALSASLGSATNNFITGKVEGKGCLNQGSIMSYAGCEALYRSAQKTQDASGNIVWCVYAKLRLKDLSDYFNKTPLLKGSTMRFQINTNQAVQSFTIAKGTLSATPTYDTLTFNAPSVLGGLTNPLMVSSAQIGCGCSALPADTYTISCSIFKNTNSSQAINSYQAGQSSLTACRLYAPVYKFNPIAEQRYLSLAPTKRVEYTDIFQYSFTKIDPNSPFNFLVTNGIQDIQSVLVVPFISAGTTAQGATYNGTSWSTLLASNTTSGATPDPIGLTNFNILVSGVNLFLNNQLYDYEQFNQELKSSNQLNGNLTTGLTSGLISEDDFSKGMRYYYGNCARILPSEVGVSRSVQIIGQNVSLKTIDLMVFVEFKRRMTIDIQTGARLE
jgi:hypothetical protein